MEVLIEKLNHTGEGIGRINNKIIFIPKTLPGDIVKVKDLQDYKKYYKGNVDSIITPSTTRISPICPYYESCGGCQLMNTSYLNQLNYKKEKVQEILKKYANIDKKLDIVLNNKTHSYRNKITLQVKAGKLGLYKYNSKELVEIKECLLVSNNINNLIKIIKKNLNLEQITKIIIREYNHNLMIHFSGIIDKKTLIQQLSTFVQTIYINDKLIHGDPQLTVKLGNYHYKVSPLSFFQVNYEQTERLYNQVLKHLSKNNNQVLDLYCGTASIGIYISKYCKNITGIEINTSSVKDALENIKLNNIKNINIIKGDVAQVLNNSQKYDTIIVDPPRSGLSKTTRKTILELNSPQIIYISCNPVTLARDLTVLKQQYIIKDITLFDMFPNTYHVESVSLLYQKNP